MPLLCGVAELWTESKVALVGRAFEQFESL